VKIPYDCPEWVEAVLTSAEDKLNAMLSKANTADEALKSTGAFSFWKIVRDEVEFEAAKQMKLLNAEKARLHERN
jgi:hypothetical protein